MADKAALSSSATFAERMLAHSHLRESRLRDVEKVVSLAARSAEAAPAEERPSLADVHGLPDVQDFTAAIALIHEASEAVRISEQRADDLEREIKGLLGEAADEVKRLKAEIAAKDAAIAVGVEQAQAAEARAHEAEAWLARLHDAVMSQLQPLQKRAS